MIGRIVQISVSGGGVPKTAVPKARVTALGLALAAVQLVPTTELTRESIRSGGLTYSEAIAFSLPPMQLPRSLIPGYWANGFSEFMGFIPLLFGALILLTSAPAYLGLAAEPDPRMVAPSNAVSASA